MIKLKTGISTSLDFIRCMKEQGHAVSPVFPAESLRDQLNAVNENVTVTFNSPNETILAATNGGEPPTPPTEQVTITVNASIENPVSPDDEQNILMSFNGVSNYGVVQTFTADKGETKSLLISCQGYSSIETDLEFDEDHSESYIISSRSQVTVTMDAEGYLDPGDTPYANIAVAGTPLGTVELPYEFTATYGDDISYKPDLDGYIPYNNSTTAPNTSGNIIYCFFQPAPTEPVSVTFSLDESMPVGDNYTLTDNFDGSEYTTFPITISHDYDPNPIDFTFSSSSADYQIPNNISIYFWNDQSTSLYIPPSTELHIGVDETLLNTGVYRYMGDEGLGNQIINSDIHFTSWDVGTGELIEENIDLGQILGTYENDYTAYVYRSSYTNFGYEDSSNTNHTYTYNFNPMAVYTNSSSQNVSVTFDYAPFIFPEYNSTISGADLEPVYDPGEAYYITMASDTHFSWLTPDANVARTESGAQIGLMLQCSPNIADPTDIGMNTFYYVTTRTSEEEPVEHALDWSNCLVSGENYGYVWIPLDVDNYETIEIHYQFNGDVGEQVVTIDLTNGYTYDSQPPEPPVN